MKNKKGFTLLEVTIVAGLMAMVGVYMMQMTNNLNKTIARMETKADEQEMMYITTLALTDKLACQRTLGSYCETAISGKPGRLSDGSYAATNSDCDSAVGPAGMGAEWKNNEFQLQEWPSTDDFKVSNINESNSIDIATTAQSSGLASTEEAIIYNRNFGKVFKACREEINFGRSFGHAKDFFSNLVEDANALPVDPTRHEGSIVIPKCEEKLYYVGNSLLMKKFLVANYPEDQGGVPVGTGSGEVGKVKFVFEYARLKEKGKIMRKDIDLYVQTNDQDEIVSCLSANDVETFSADSTYVLEQDFDNGTGGVSVRNNCPDSLSDMGASRCYSVSCASGDELINGDSIAFPDHRGIRCDLALPGANTDNCRVANCINPTDLSFNESCPSECRRQIYTRYECREYDDIDNLVGVRVICARRYSN